MVESIRLTSANRVSATASSATAVSSVLTEGDGGRAVAGGDGWTHPHKASDAISANKPWDARYGLCERRPVLSIHQDMIALRVSQHHETEGTTAFESCWKPEPDNRRNTHAGRI